MLSLFGRCNNEIYRTLSEQATDEKFDFFLINFHLLLSPKFLEPSNHNLFIEHYSFYGEKFQRLIVSYLCQKSATDPEVYGRLLEVMPRIVQFAHAGSLARLFYEQFCSNDSLRSRLKLDTVYKYLAEYRLPFVDYDLVASKLMSSVEQLRKSLLNEDDQYDVSRMLRLLQVALYPFLLRLARSLFCFKANETGINT